MYMRFTDIIGQRITPLLLCMIIAFISCGKKELPSKPAVPQTNIYSSESVFDEVKKKLQNNPNDIDALYHLADLYDRNAQYNEAIDAYKKVISLKPYMARVKTQPEIYFKLFLWQVLRERFCV